MESPPSSSTRNTTTKTNPQSEDTSNNNNSSSTKNNEFISVPQRDWILTLQSIEEKERMKREQRPNIKFLKLFKRIFVRRKNNNNRRKKKKNSKKRNQTCHRGKSQQKKRNDNDETSPIDAVRHIPELMIQIYSFLPIPDRVSTLAQVDKKFSSDIIRSGFTVGMYGGKYSLSQALDQLHRWAVQKLEALDYDQDVPSYIERVRRAPYQISCMQDKVDALRFIGRDMLDVYDDHFAPSHRMGRKTPHWLEDLVTVRKFSHRIQDNDGYNRLESLMDDEDFHISYASYCRNRQCSPSRRWPKALPNLDPGLTLMLPDNDNGFRKHKFVQCCGCNGLQLKYLTWKCHHDRRSYLCKECDQGILTYHGCDCNTRHAMSCTHCSHEQQYMEERRRLALIAYSQ
jgi:hypothetical protein